VPKRAEGRSAKLKVFCDGLKNKSALPYLTGSGKVSKGYFYENKLYE
jgi:hypothetical protein